MLSSSSPSAIVTPFTSQRPRVLVQAVSRSNNDHSSGSRREFLHTGLATVLTATTIWGDRAQAADPKKAQAPPVKVLCDEECLSSLEGVKEVRTASGLRYKDIIPGKGPSPPTGYQVVADYVAMTSEGRVFDSSLERGRPYDLRIGSGQIVAGLDEGVANMKVGGLRRIYVPGNLSFPKGLPSGPGRPRVPPSSPVIFDVQLLYIPGVDSEEE